MLNFPSFKRRHWASPTRTVIMSLPALMTVAASYGERTKFMIALASNLNLLGSRFSTGLAAVFLARLREASAW